MERNEYADLRLEGKVGLFLKLILQKKRGGVNGYM